jgi:hypothetical protein
MRFIALLAALAALTACTNHSLVEAEAADYMTKHHADAGLATILVGAVWYKETM